MLGEKKKDQYRSNHLRGKLTDRNCKYSEGDVDSIYTQHPHSY